MLRKLKPSTGFTTIELVMVIVILGIVSVTIAPRFFDNTVFQARGFSDQLLAALRYAQKTAIAQHRRVCVDVTATSITLTIATLNKDSSCSLPLNLPDRTENTLSAPAGISVAPATTSLTFDALGRASSAATITVSGVSNPITVEAETGYVHQ